MVTASFVIYQSKTRFQA